MRVGSADLISSPWLESQGEEKKRFQGSEDFMQQQPPFQTPEEQPPFVTLKSAEKEIGISRVTLKRYLALLEILPRSFHIGDRSLYISQEEKERVKKLKEKPMLIEQLRSLVQRSS
jgi:hypothetical protein